MIDNQIEDPEKGNMKFSSELGKCVGLLGVCQTI